MDIETKLHIITRGAEEIVTVDELKELLERGGGEGYLGFEPSGVFHVGWFVWALKFKDLVEAGIKMKLLAATWHAWINDKLGGDLGLIRKASTHVKAVLDALGIEGRYEFVYAEDLVKDMKYWEMLLRAAKKANLARVKRALTIMGRKEEEASTDFSRLIYPLMQVTDINYMGLDVALGGMDQRKAHMLQRDLADRLGWKKVIAIHTPLIPSLQGSGRMESASGNSDDMLIDIKMSKSKPESAIFIIDSDDAIRSKLRKAYCPPRIVSGNPIMGMAKYIIFRDEEKEFIIDRPSRFGGPITVGSYEELEKMYLEGKIHPLDLKNAVADYLIEIIGPIREKLLRNSDLKAILDIVMMSVSR